MGHELLWGAYASPYAEESAGYHVTERTGAFSARGTSTAQSTATYPPAGVSKLSVHRSGVQAKSSQTDNSGSARGDAGSRKTAANTQSRKTRLFMVLLHSLIIPHPPLTA